MAAPRDWRLTTTAAVACLALAGCSSSGSDEDGAGPGNSVRDLVIDTLNAPDSLDPLYRDTPEAEQVYRLTHSTILRWKEDQSLAPDLAAEMPEVSADGLTFTVRLREGVTFHDGTALTAEDVVHTFAEAAEPENGSVWLSSTTFIDSVEAADELTVEMKLSKPYAYLDSRLAMIPILSSEEKYVPNETWARRSNGSGPYRLESTERGESISLARNDDYYSELPPYETIKLAVVPENASRIARLVNGETHIVPDLPADQIDLVTSRGQRAETVEGNTSRLFAWPSQQAGRPTVNPAFRLALAWAIDRTAIVDQVFHGAGRPNSTYLTFGTQYHNEELGTHFGERPNIEKAKQHLAASGVDLDRKFNIIAYNQPAIVQAATIIQANLAELGIEATVDAEEVAAFFPKMVSGDYDLILYNSPSSISTGFAPDYVNGGLNSTSSSNFNAFADESLDQLLNAAMVAGPAEQEAAWHAVQNRDLEIQGNIQIVVSQNSQAWSKELGDYRPSNLAWFNTLLPGY
ncbi:ABC transporter substrate-binding protein [Nocardioides pantholopis]|uniref:ABC transporter substrate-binding protein n=1 Tax=Nocardioides pantholopis TaxID=2483798 RepID=UPI000F0778A8|nr:ABC transporter substrate-binding protein [Nocardioides pantholopis]